MKSLSPKLYESIKGAKVLRQNVEKLRSSNIEKVKLDPELKSKITNEIYKDDIIELQDILNKKLDHWLS